MKGTDAAGAADLGATGAAGLGVAGAAGVWFTCAPGLGIATKLARNPTPAPAVSTVPAASIVDPKREQAPAGHSVTADKFAETPAATPRVKVNDPQVQPKSTAGNENTESKPAEMKVANAVDREPYLESTKSGFGNLVAVRHSAQFSMTPARWTRPSVPPGTDPPAWP